MVLYSPQHIARLEKAGTFPLMVKLGNNRVGWVESEALDWLQEKLNARKNQSTLLLKEQGWPDVNNPVTRLVCTTFISLRSPLLGDL